MEGTGCKGTIYEKSLQNAALRFVYQLNFHFGRKQLNVF